MNVQVLNIYFLDEIVTTTLQGKHNAHTAAETEKLLAYVHPNTFRVGVNFELVKP